MTHKRVLEYLKKKGQTNTFRLARDLGIDRHKILDIIKRFEDKKLVELKFGTVKFLKFPEKGKKLVKKIIEVKKALSASKKRIKHKAIRALQKKAMSKRKSSILEDLQAENKEFKERFLALEKTIKELQLKASAPPKIIRRTIVKNIIKKVPVERIEAKPKKFKLPRFNLGWLKNIQRLAKPEFIKQKVNIGMPKISFAQLNKNIQQIHVPEVLSKSI